MGDTFPKVQVAVVQAAPILFDREATVEKVVAAISQSRRALHSALMPLPIYPPSHYFGQLLQTRRLGQPAYQAQR